jgi:hypothetical protein
MKASTTMVRAAGALVALGVVVGTAAVVRAEAEVFKWSAPLSMNPMSSRGHTTLAENAGVLHVVYQGDGDVGALIWSKFDGAKWQPAVVLPGKRTTGAPALGAFRGTLYLVHTPDASGTLHFAQLNGNTWSPSVSMSMVARYKPSLIVFDPAKPAPGARLGKSITDRLYLAFTGTDNKIRLATFDGTTWSAPMETQHAGTFPQLVVHNDKLHLLYVGVGGSQVTQSTLQPDGKWSNPFAVSTHKAYYGVGAATCGGRAHMVHRGPAAPTQATVASDGYHPSADDALLWGSAPAVGACATPDCQTWTAPVGIPNFGSWALPSVGCFQNKAVVIGLGPGRQPWLFYATFTP